MVFADNTILEGNFIDGLVDGYGRFIDKNCNYYIGKWTQGKKDGNGTEVGFRDMS